MSCTAASKRFGNASSFSRAGIPHLGIPERRNLAGKASLKIRVPMPKIGWHVMITLHYSNVFPRRSWLSAMPAPDTASLGRLQTQGNGEATAGPNWMGPNVHTVEESGRCQHLSSLGTDFRAVHAVIAVMGESFLRGREYSTAHGRSRNVAGGGIPANLEDPPAITGCFVTMRCSPGLGV